MQEQPIYYTIFSSSVGYIALAMQDNFIVHISISSNKEILMPHVNRSLPNNSIIYMENNENLNQYAQFLTQYLKEPHTVDLLSLQIKTTGTPLQQEVWNFLRTIPLGKTLSYKELALKINKPFAVRAIANACAANKIAIVIPCHRIIKTNGDLSGYRWGVHIKQNLLTLEKNHLNF